MASTRSASRRVRVSRNSRQASAATAVALQVDEARARVVQYALSANMDDQRAAQAGLAALDQAIENTGDGETDLRAAPPATAARWTPRSPPSRPAGPASSNCKPRKPICGPLSRRWFNWPAPTATRHCRPRWPVWRAVLAPAMPPPCGSWRRARQRMPMSPSPRCANAARKPRHLGPSRRGQSPDGALYQGVADPLDRFGEGLRQVVAADERLRTVTGDRDAAASAAVLEAAASQRDHAVASAESAVTGMLASTGSAYRLGLITAAGAVCIGLVLAVLIGSSVARPVQHLTRAMRALACGESQCRGSRHGTP